MFAITIATVMPRPSWRFGAAAMSYVPALANMAVEERERVAPTATCSRIPDHRVERMNAAGVITRFARYVECGERFFETARVIEQWIPRTDRYEERREGKIERGFACGGNIFCCGADARALGRRQTGRGPPRRAPGARGT